MGLFASLVGYDKIAVAKNALLESHLFDTADAKLKQTLTERIVFIA